jgi:ketosteroid isomerase-like protein
MSQENVEIVQDGFAAYARGDLPAMLDRFASDVVVTTRPDQPDVRDFLGHDGVIEQMTEWIETWDGFSIEILRVREVEDFVIVVAHETGHGALSGVPMDDEVTYVFKIAAGKISRWQMFGTEPEAVKAVGLAE